MKYLVLLLFLFTCAPALAVSYPANCPADGAHANVYNTATNVWSCVSITTSGGAVAISSTTSNQTFYPLMATSTSAAASSIYIDTTSPFPYNPSTGLLSPLGITTTTITDNGNAALKGTTTITSAQILAGNALVTTITATTANVVGALSFTSTAAAPTNGISSPLANKLSISTNGATALTVSTTQSVGIGTTTPQAMLDIGTGVNNFLQLIAGGISSIGTDFEVRNTSAGAHNFQFFTDGSGNLPGWFTMGDTSTNDQIFAMTSTTSSAGQLSFSALNIVGWTNNNTNARAACDTCISRDSAGVFDFGTGAFASKAATLNAATINQNGTQVISVAGTGLSQSGSTLNSNATEHISFQPGLLTSITNTIGVFYKASKAMTTDNLEASALLLSCVANPTITMYECGTSTTCATPTTIGTATVTTTGTVVDGTVSSAAIAAGHYVGFAISAGTCTSLDIAATSQIHAN